VRALYDDQYVIMTFQCVENDNSKVLHRTVSLVRDVIRVVAVNTHNSKRDALTCSIPFTLSHTFSLMDDALHLLTLMAMLSGACKTIYCK
jgi:hypothetical protein